MTTALAKTNASVTTGPMPEFGARWRNGLFGKTWFLGTGPTAPAGDYINVHRGSYLPNLIGHGYDNSPGWFVDGAALQHPQVVSAVERYRTALAALPDQFPANLPEDAFHSATGIGNMLIKVEREGLAPQVMRIDQHAATGVLRELVDSVHALAGVARLVGRT